jgi:hypothetical protein
MTAKLETLEQKFREAQENYSDDPSEANHKKYRQAKLKFTQARVEQRQAEEQDPDHSRGNGLVVITDEVTDEDGDK